MVETETGGHKPPAKPAAPKAAAPAATPAAAPAAPKPAAPAAPKPAAAPATHKAGADPNRQLFKRSTYVGVKDTGPVAGESFEQKVARLKALSAAAKQRAEEGGEPLAAAEVTEVLTELAPDQTVAPHVAEPEAPAPAPAASAAPAAAHKPTGNADRALMKRGTYCGVVDTGPVPGETQQQKIARLTALSAAAKQRSEGG